MKEEHKIKKSKLPWVFWLSVSIRRKWFKRLWKTRGANFIEYQVWIFKISIGRPWIQEVVHGLRKDYSSHNHIRETNKENLKYWFSFQVGKNPKNLNQ